MAIPFFDKGEGIFCVSALVCSDYVTALVCCNTVPAYRGWPAAFVKSEAIFTSPYNPSHPCEEILTLPSIRVLRIGNFKNRE